MTKAARKKRLSKLINVLENGPDFKEPYNVPWDDYERGYKAQYIAWAYQQIIPEIKELVKP